MPHRLEPVQLGARPALVADRPRPLFQRAVGGRHGLVPELTGPGRHVLGALDRVGDALLEAEPDREGVGDRVPELAAGRGLGRVVPGPQHREVAAPGLVGEVPVGDGTAVALGEVVGVGRVPGPGHVDASRPAQPLRVGGVHRGDLQRPVGVVGRAPPGRQPARRVVRDEQRRHARVLGGLCEGRRLGVAGEPGEDRLAPHTVREGPVPTSTSGSRRRPSARVPPGWTTASPIPRTSSSGLRAATPSGTRSRPP